MKYSHGSTVVTKEDRDRLFREAFTKKAQDAGGGPNATKNTVTGAVVGTLLGGGLGYLNYKMTPKDVDEDDRKKLLSHLLSGAALGGIAGAGIGYYRAIPRVVDTVKSLANAEPVTNTQIGRSLGKSIDTSPPGRAIAGTLLGRYGVGTGLGFASDAIEDNAVASALLNRSGTGSVIDSSGVEQNPLHNWGPRVATLRAIQAGGYDVATSMPVLNELYNLRMRYPGDLSRLPLSAEAQIMSTMNTLNLLPPGATSADAMRLFDRYSKTAMRAIAKTQRTPTFMQNLFSSRGRYNKIGSKALAVVGGLMGWFTGGGNAGVDTTTPAGNRRGE